MQTIAIIGSGISGLGCAWFLHRDFEVTVFEADNHIGGHSHTVALNEGPHQVRFDTGFMVYNQVTYPNFSRLLAKLRVATKPTDMSFSVRDDTRNLEYCGSSLNHLFAQRRNLLNPSFYRMLLQINRFNKEAHDALADPRIAKISLGSYIEQQCYSDDFLKLYLTPMSGAVWSTPPEKMLQFPAASLLRFFHNHGFLGLHTQHRWWTIEGGAASYVERMIEPFHNNIFTRTPVRSVRRVDGKVRITTATETRDFDKVILACHAPTSVQLLADGILPQEKALLSAFQYQPNVATVHTDDRVLPKRRLARASWNYRIETPVTSAARPRTSTHYWMNSLQGVSKNENYFVSIDGGHLAAPDKVRLSIPCEHPLFDLAAHAAQPEIENLNSRARQATETYFAGAWQRYGFHEDGLLSAVNLSKILLNRDPWPKA